MTDVPRNGSMFLARFLQYQLDFKRNELTDLGTTGTVREALTWHKDLLATLRRFDESEAAFVAPGLNSAVEMEDGAKRWRDVLILSQPKRYLDDR
jgi:transposase